MGAYHPVVSDEGAELLHDQDTLSIVRRILPLMPTNEDDHLFMKEGVIVIERGSYIQELCNSVAQIALQSTESLDDAIRLLSKNSDFAKDASQERRGQNFE